MPEPRGDAGDRARSWSRRRHPRRETIPEDPGETMSYRAFRNTLTALLIFCGLFAASAPGQSVTMTVQPDTAFRVFATYRSASGTASSAVNVTVVSRCPAFTIAPVPGTTRGRYVYVLGVQVGACWQVASATVSSRTYFDSLHVASSQQTRFAVAVAPVPPPDRK